MIKILADQMHHQMFDLYTSLMQFVADIWFIHIFNAICCRYLIYTHF